MDDHRRFQGVVTDPQGVAVIGGGYVGLPTAVQLAYLGHRVVLAERDDARRRILAAGRSPLLEPDLEELLGVCRASGRLVVVADAGEAATGARFVFLCVNTPTGPDGRANLADVDRAVTEIAPRLAPGAIVVTKSTVPVGTTARVAARLGRSDVAVVANPEFLRESRAVADTFFPVRVVAGGEPADAAAVGALFAVTGAPLIVTDARTAELTKYAANAFLAMKVSFANAVSELCDAVGADVATVTDALGRDSRIGPGHLAVGPGWGGPCLPKDLAALIGTAHEYGVASPLLEATLAANARHQDHVVAVARALVGGALAGVTVGVLGLAFKAGTGDRRESPAVAVVRRLLAAGALVRAHDPAVAPATTDGDLFGVDLATDAIGAVSGAQLVLVLTEWPVFGALDWSAMAAAVDRRVVLDTRGVVDGPRARASGFAVHRLGQPALS